MSGEMRGESKTAPEGAVGPDRSGGVQHHVTPQEPRLETPVRTRTAVLIDGFNLYHGMRERFAALLVARPPPDGQPDPATRRVGDH